MEPELVSRSQAYRSLALAFRPPEAGAGRDLALAYTRLFLGPGRPIAHPYESACLEGQLMGQATAQVAACYAEAGLQVVCADDFSVYSRELPDHISIELAFMAHLAAQAEREPDQKEIWRDRQRRFLGEHLARWLPQFCQKVIESDIAPFYREAAREARRLIEEDLARLTISDFGFRTSDQFAIRNPKSAMERRYPNLHLGLDLSRCSLCSLCADNCRPGALKVDCTPATISLAFDPARCNGCRACLRLCPEKAISLERGSPLTAPPARPVGTTLVVASAPRVICPGCHRPHVAEPWLERLAERLGGGEPARRSLALCPVCKVTSGNGRPVPVELPQESFASD